MTTYIVKAPADWSALADKVAAMQPPLTITIVEGEPRTDPQNHLQHKWIAEAAKQLNEPTEDLRAYCKLHFGVPILRNESMEYKEAYDRDIRPLPYEMKLRLMAVPFDFAVTRNMSKKQKTDYLDAIHQHFASLGCKLTEPGR